MSYSCDGNLTNFNYVQDGIVYSLRVRVDFYHYHISLRKGFVRTSIRDMSDVSVPRLFI